MNNQNGITGAEEIKIKELFSVHKKFRTVAAIVKRDPLTVKKVLGVRPKNEEAKIGIFNWKDFNNSII